MRSRVIGPLTCASQRVQRSSIRRIIVAKHHDGLAKELVEWALTFPEPGRFRDALAGAGAGARARQGHYCGAAEPKERVQLASLCSPCRPAHGLSHLRGFGS